VDVELVTDLSDIVARADVIVYPADMEDASRLIKLTPEGVRPVMLFQGFGVPGNPIVRLNLRIAREVVATSTWLCAAASSRGAPTVYLPYGLDRSVFKPGPPAGERGLQVTAMTHSSEWKGVEDLSAALAIIHRTRPDAEITVFGTTPLDGVPAKFLERPQRREVARVLAASAVHVVSSWEEGFGMPGAEALMCGAALASTDTKGSRDYAFDGRTALISPPRDAEALARSVLTLLDEPAERGRLAAHGQRQVRALLPPWREVACRFAALLAEGA
jgi:glycosyltransferase involved in cell wall biosynthesis